MVGGMVPNDAWDDYWGAYSRGSNPRTGRFPSIRDGLRQVTRRIHAYVQLG